MEDITELSTRGTHNSCTDIVLFDNTSKLLTNHSTYSNHSHSSCTEACLCDDCPIKYVYKPFDQLDLAENMKRIMEGSAVLRYCV